MRSLPKWSLAGAMLAALFILCGCANAPLKPLPPQVQTLAPSAFVVLADGAVGLAVSKGVKPADIAGIAFQLQQFAGGSSVTVQALTSEIQRLEVKAGFNTEQLLAVIEIRKAFDTIIAGYVTNGALSPTARTTLNEILQDLIAAAELLGAPDPAAASSTATTADSMGPPAPPPSSPVIATLESPTVVGAAVSTVLVASLKAFAHVNVSSPVAASIAVLGTFLAGWIAEH